MGGKQAQMAFPVESDQKESGVLRMFSFPTRAQVERIRAAYPAGTRIVLISMEDPYTHLKPGDIGTVQGVDDAGQIMMKWDRGGSLSLIPGEDQFRRAE